MIFFSGYALTATFFPTKDRINLIERIGLSIMISLLSALIIGLILSFTSFKGNLNMIIMLLSFVTIFGVISAYIRRLDLSSDEQFDLEIYQYLKNIKVSLWKNGKINGKLSVLLIILLILSIATTIYLIAYPTPGESFTEFYLLGPNGKAADYPTILTSGSTGKVIIGIVNHEHKTTNYKLVITSNGKVIDQKNLTLNDGQKIDINYSFVPSGTGKRKIEFLLYKLPDDKNPYSSLHIFVNVK